MFEMLSYPQVFHMVSNLFHLFHPCMNGKHYICIATTLSPTWIWAMLKLAEVKNRVDLTKMYLGSGGWVQR